MPTKQRKKIVVIGFGSIGSRHTRILLEKFPCELFLFRSQKSKKQNQYQLPEIYSWKEVADIHPDIAFITNPTSLHIDTALRCARLNTALFIEKPLGSSVRKLDKLLNEIKKRNLVTYIAYNLRFHPVIEYIKDLIDNKTVYHSAVYASAYLPEWRKGRDHRSTYSAQADMGGGVILDLSHEFDYIEFLFGTIHSIIGKAKKTSTITVDAEDCADAFIETTKTIINLHLNFMSLNFERSIKIDYEDGFLYGDLIKNTVAIKSKEQKLIKRFRTGTEKTYEKQLRYFFKNIHNPQMMNNIFEAEALFRKILEFRNTAYGTIGNHRGPGRVKGRKK